MHTWPIPKGDLLCRAWTIYDVYPQYDPSLDWIGLDGGNGPLFIGTRGLAGIKVGDTLFTSEDKPSIVVYVDQNTLVTRQK